MQSAASTRSASLMTAYRDRGEAEGWEVEPWHTQHPQHPVSGMVWAPFRRTRSPEKRPEMNVLASLRQSLQYQFQTAEDRQDTTQDP